MRTPVAAQVSPPITEVSVKELDTRLAEIARSHTGTYEAAVYEPESGKTFGINPDRPFMAASLAKLPVLIALYKAAARHELSLDEKISILPSDVQNYGTGVLNGYPVGSTMTLRECASYLIKESDNTAWVMLERRLGRAKIEAELAGLGAQGTNYQAITTTPRDVMLMLRAIADPGYTTPDLSSEMLSLMTGTAYEDRLPEPLPKGTRVAHKIGSYEDTFSDAGVIFHKSPDGKENNYFIVVVGRNTTEDEARAAIREMSLATYQAFIDPLAADPASKRG
ncbi:MAG TPA: serine hydrolase [Rubrobacteraceae bacterium]|nr:serine hydrolase [Rubrobacteraceae bacterium]